MLVAASIFTKDLERLHRRWRLEGVLPNPGGRPADDTSKVVVNDVSLWPKESFTIQPPGSLAPAFEGSSDQAGHMVFYDWSTKEIVWMSDWESTLMSPAGFCFADGCLYVNDLEGASIFVIDVSERLGRIVDRISHPYLNDIHSLERTRRGLLIASSGTDAVIELDRSGHLIYDWWAADFGYEVTPSGEKRKSGRGQEHRNIRYHTRFHATHLNHATFRDREERFLLVVLFHQGQILQIDRARPPRDQTPEVVLDGLSRPHGLKAVEGGWLICDSADRSFYLLDAEFRIQEKVSYDGGWIQDCTLLSSGEIILDDADHHVMVSLSGPGWRRRSAIPFEPNWRMGQLTEVPRGYEKSIRSALAEGRVESAKHVAGSEVAMCSV